MKALILILCLGLTSFAFAAEVDTDCPAMNQSREKIVKVVKSKSVKSSQSSAQ